MSSKKYFLLMLLLTPQVGALSVGKKSVPSQLVSGVVTESQKRPAVVQKTNQWARVKQWVSGKYAVLRKGVDKKVSSVWTVCKDKAQSAKNSVSKSLNSGKNKVKSNPKSYAALGGLISYFLSKPVVEKYMKWKSEDKTAITGLLAVLGAATLALGRYTGKLPAMSPSVVASFFAGIVGAGVLDYVYTDYTTNPTTENSGINHI